MARPYANGIKLALQGDIDMDNGLFWQLHASGYTPNLVTDDYQADLTNEIANGAGYATGGLSAGAATITVTAANSWAVQRANSATYAVDDVVRPAAANGFLYRATSAGAAAGAPPTYPLVLGQTVTDGAVVWENVGSAIVVVSVADPVWAAPFTATGIRHAVLIDKTSGSSATNPLLAVVTFGSDQAGGGGSWTIDQHDNLRTFHFFVP